MAYQIGKKLSESIIKVELNDFGDCIFINASDATFQQRFSDFVKWVNEKQKELAQLAEEKGKLYEGRKIITQDEEGNSQVDVEQLTDLIGIQMNFYRDCEAQINALFGQDALKKYFRVFYEYNPDFVPDEACIEDFLEEITPVLNQVYNTRFERLKERYNKNRKGRNTKVVQMNE